MYWTGIKFAGLVKQKAYLQYILKLKVNSKNLLTDHK